MKIDRANLTLELAAGRVPYSNRSTSELKEKRAQAIKEIEMCNSLNTFHGAVYAHIYIETIASIDQELVVRN